MSANDDGADVSDLLLWQRRPLRRLAVTGHVGLVVAIRSKALSAVPEIKVCHRPTRGDAAGSIRRLLRPEDSPSSLACRHVRHCQPQRLHLLERPLIS